VKQAMFAYVNQAQIRSWNQPVLSNEGKVFLLKETNGAFAGACQYDHIISDPNSFFHCNLVMLCTMYTINITLYTFCSGLNSWVLITIFLSLVSVWCCIWCGILTHDYVCL